MAAPTRFITLSYSSGVVTFWPCASVSAPSQTITVAAISILRM
jgi:hypothetical protein